MPKDLSSEDTAKKSSNSLEDNKRKERSGLKRAFYVLPRFLVRILYRVQYGYTKLNVFVQIINTVSLLLLLFNAADFFNVKWWHLLIIYLGLIFLLLFVVFIF